MTWTRPTLAAVTVLVAAAAPASAQRPAPLCQGHRATMVGTPGDDQLVGTQGPDVIAARAGHDVVRGVRGNDLLCGGRGDDLVRGGKGDDGMEGGGGADRLLGGKGFDLVSFASSGRAVDVDLARGTATGAGRDRIESVWWVIGSPFADDVRGTNAMEILMPLGGRDRVHGRGGRDLIDGGPGDDALSGGRGVDVVLGRGGDDTLTGGPGADTASFAGAENPVSVDLGSGRAAGEGRDSLRGFEDVEGSDHPDVIEGDRARNVVVGGEGADRVLTRGGNDRVLGLVGDDRIRLGPGDDLARGGRDDDWIDGGAGIDRTYGGAGHDVCRNGEVLGCDEYELPLPDTPWARRRAVSSSANRCGRRSPRRSTPPSRRC